MGVPAGSASDCVPCFLAEHMKDYAPSIMAASKPRARGRLRLETLKGGDRDGSTMMLTLAYHVALFPFVYAKLDTAANFLSVCAVCNAEYLLPVGRLVPAIPKAVVDLFRGTYNSSM